MKKNYIIGWINKPDTVTRKNLEFIFTIVTVLLGLYFAHKANSLASDNEKQNLMIYELSKQTEQLSKQTEQLKNLLEITSDQSIKINNQLDVIVKNHYNDSLQFQISVFNPLLNEMIRNIISLNDDLDELNEFKFTNNEISTEVIACLTIIDKKVNEILNNSITLTHRKERDKLVMLSPKTRNTISLVNKLSENKGTVLIVKNNSNLNFLNDELENVKKNLFAFIQQASDYQTTWYRARPIK